MEIPIEGIDCRVEEDMLIIESSSPLETLSSAVLNGGLRDADAIVNCRVSESYDHVDPEGYLRAKVRSVGLKPEKVIGLMTAVDPCNTALTAKKLGNLTVCSVVSAGLSNAAKAGERLNPHPGTGTINIIVIVDGFLTEACMVDAVKVATEAKSMALIDLDVRSSFSDMQASGTTSDAIVIACTGRGERFRYAGTATELGELISLSITRSIKEAIEKQEGITPNRPIIQRLRERGITVEEMVDAALTLFCPHPGIETRERAYEMLEEELKRIMSDINVASLILSGIRLDEDGRRGLIPNLPADVFRRDPVFLLADEMLGLAIANYVAGTRGIFEFIRFDRAKPGILGRLSPILDDVICGIISGASSRIYTRALDRSGGMNQKRSGHS